MFTKQFWVAGLLFLSTASYAKGVIIPKDERVVDMKRAEVWFAPAWIDSNFNFSPDLKMLVGPPLKHEEQRLLQDAIDCNVVPNGVGTDTGLTRKFICSLATGDSENPTLDIKVKYGQGNAEVSGELIATRLFWALGFGADRMYFMPTTRCFGCTADPFKHRELDPTSLTDPREFTATAIERKFHGASLDKPIVKYVMSGGPHPSRIAVPSSISGWNFKELLSAVSDDPRLRADQLMKRNALALLAAFINHADSKMQNQRLVCMDPIDAEGKCSGRVAMIIQDLGSVFGKGFKISILELLRVDYQGWSTSPIWRDPAKCVAGTSFWFTQSFRKIAINESGRQFLVKLLKGFSAGREGRKRVEDIFRAGHVELRGPATASQWADLFMRKVKELEFPMGEADPNFQCPQ